jgi:hypothetical protein
MVGWGDFARTLSLSGHINLPPLSLLQHSKKKCRNRMRENERGSSIGKGLTGKSREILYKAFLSLSLGLSFPSLTIFLFLSLQRTLLARATFLLLSRKERKKKKKRKGKKEPLA